MAEATENSELLLNSSSTDMVLGPNLDFRRTEQIQFDNSQILTNNISPLPSLALLQSQIGLPQTKDFKETGCSGVDLIKIMKRYNQFRGLITIQELRQKLRYNLINVGGYFVSINKNTPGHIVGVMVLPNYVIEYFDSAGNEPADLNPESNYEVIYNTVKLQNDGNMTCGLHAWFFLTLRFQDISMDDIIKLYPSQCDDLTLEDNDTFVNDKMNEDIIKWLYWRNNPAT
ncbi:hypothetical protein LOTGIDRAFT_152562 [Lottia gigantea]|uniref:Uncharacterized protein n=1 Tax=Lottia gigantea TaxID=225164 RepID=V4CT01_LOTGI|nr:hypothetical protein LOTGIDRAFT_152562 [Lottia gigantea]ESP05695.1 hypothetical protein LOTGIDRAFT_152562 [Lottia gigantea]